MNRFSRRTLFRLACLSAAAEVAFQTRADAARSAKPKLKFSEVFGDVRTAENVSQEGRLRIEIVLPLTGLSLKKVNGETAFFIGLGDVTMAGTLADDPRYRAGKKSARIKDRGRELLLEWNKRRLLATLTVSTERGEPGAFAETYMPSPDGPIEGSSLSFTSFDFKTNRLDIQYQGEKVTRDGLRRIRLTGGGDTDCGCG